MDSSSYTFYGFYYTTLIEIVLGFYFWLQTSETLGIFLRLCTLYFGKNASGVMEFQFTGTGNQDSYFEENNLHKQPS